MPSSKSAADGSLGRLQMPKKPQILQTVKILVWMEAFRGSSLVGSFTVNCSPKSQNNCLKRGSESHGYRPRGWVFGPQRVAGVGSFW